jgi:DNA invertase Pin-like site-specific DNA recombinase
LRESYAGLKMTKQVVELIRVSTEGQAAPERAGIPAQKAANRQTAAQHGLDIIRTIEISDVSGAAVLRSPEMQELLRLIECADIHGVVAKEFSRLMRPENFGDYILLQAFADTATILYLPDGPIDFRSKSGRLFGTLRAAMAGLERTEILERMWAAKEEKRRAGKHPQSRITLPYGVEYDSEKGLWFFNDDSNRVLEAFRLFLSGETSYTEVGRKVGINPINLRNILRNPIYTGWRVYDKRRDPSARAIRTRPDGRQADRPKIPREPQDVIRVKVLDGLLSCKDFQQVQRIMALKKENHWRARPEHQRRFTYSGFLKCGVCGNLIYSHSNRRHDWYVCKSRTWPVRGAREKMGLTPCSNPYMGRARVESLLDTLFSERLTNQDLLRQIVDEYLKRSNSATREAEVERSERTQKSLAAKRKRLLDAYLENLLNRSELSQRLEELQVQERLCDEKIRSILSIACPVSAGELAQILEPLVSWKFLSRVEKRQILHTIIPEIYLENFAITKLALHVEAPDHIELNHMDTGSWPPPA